MSSFNTNVNNHPQSSTPSPTPPAPKSPEYQRLLQRYQDLSDQNKKLEEKLAQKEHQDLQLKYLRQEVSELKDQMSQKTEVDRRFADQCNERDFYDIWLPLYRDVADAIDYIQKAILPSKDTVSCQPCQLPMCQHQYQAMHNMLLSLINLLNRRGVDQIRTKLRQRFDPSIHQSKTTIKTTNPKWDNRIAQFKTLGWRDAQGRLIRKVEVVIYQFVSNSHTPQVNIKKEI